MHIEAVKTILKYVKGTKDRGIVYGQGTLTIEGYSDSDWAGDKDSRKSTSGYIFMLNGGPVNSCSKRQAAVAIADKVVIIPEEAWTEVRQNLEHV